MQHTLEELTSLKDKGNQFFKQKKFTDAIVQFKHVVNSIEVQQSKDYLSPTTQIGKLYVVCLINAAFACININQLEQYSEAIAYCDKALSVDQGNLKGLYRRGLARKQKAHLMETSQGVKVEGLLQIYTQAKQDFQKVCVLDRTNELATKHLSESVKDIYRVTVARGEEVDFKSKKQSNEANSNHQKNPYLIPEGAKKRKGPDMDRILQEYKVKEVTMEVQDKVRNQYLTNPLPETRSDLEKAIRTIEKSQQTFLKFVYRFDETYLKKIQPTFDMLETFVKIIQKLGQSEPAKNVLLAVKAQKSFSLLWKSFSKKQKQAFKQKWMGLGLPENEI